MMFGGTMERNVWASWAPLPPAPTFPSTVDVLFSSASRSLAGWPSTIPGWTRLTRTRPVQDGLAAQTPELTGAPEARHAHHDRGHDERNDQHLQGVDEQRPDEVVGAVEGDAEDRAVVACQPAGDDACDDGDEDLPVELELTHAEPGSRFGAWYRIGRSAPTGRALPVGGSSGPIDPGAPDRG
jgi:hypothetical protein